MYKSSQCEKMGRKYWVEKFHFIKIFHVTHSNMRDYKKRIENFIIWQISLKR